ncbi:MAG: ABC transporter substrate-binding protein [Oscillospiraceae bacterium]|jgi:iron complex transport system substrate-binding protein
MKLQGRIRPFLVLFLALTSLLWLLPGCSGGRQAGATAPASEDYEPVTISNYGRTVTINGRPEKVLTLGPNCTELFVALGLSDLVIGNSLNNHSRGPLPEYAEEYKKIPELTFGSATREAVISSGADFIYGIDWEFGGEGLDIQELESYGISVYVNSAATFEDAYQEILDLGRIFKIEERAEAFVLDQKERIAAVRESVSGFTPVKVLVYDSGGDGVFTCGGTNFETFLIEQAGGVNIFSDITDKQWTTVSYEAVIERQPEVIVIHDYNVPSLEEKIAEIKLHPVLSQLECVKQERFVSIPLESVLPGSRMAYAVETLADGIHPNR